MKESIVIAGGCFWCIEAIFKKVRGVLSLESGYTGGTTQNPTYKDVCWGTTNHTEAVRVYFDDLAITLEEILEIFFKTHDPTTLNRQGDDVGTQYRSAIFYNSEIQKEKALRIKSEIDKSNYYKNPIVTEISELKNFYRAEKYHQDYYELNKNQPYCRIVIDPKVKKFINDFKDILKSD